MPVNNWLCNNLEHTAIITCRAPCHQRRAKNVNLKRLGTVRTVHLFTGELEFVHAFRVCVSGVC